VEVLPFVSAVLCIVKTVVKTCENMQTASCIVPSVTIMEKFTTQRMQNFWSFYWERTSEVEAKLQLLGKQPKRHVLPSASRVEMKRVLVRHIVSLLLLQKMRKKKITKIRGGFVANVPKKKKQIVAKKIKKE
jgi:hypothetical protein